MEAIANLILNSDTAVAFVVTALVGLFAKWILSKPDSKFTRYQGLIATAVRAAERAIPDDTPNKSAARADHALKAFADGFEKATGAVPDAKVIEYAALTIPAVHQMLEAQGLLKKAAPALLALFLLAPAMLLTGCAFNYASTPIMSESAGETVVSDAVTIKFGFGTKDATTIGAYKLSADGGLSIDNLDTRTDSTAVMLQAITLGAQLAGSRLGVQTTPPAAAAPAASTDPAPGCSEPPDPAPAP